MDKETTEIRKEAMQSPSPTWPLPTLSSQNGKSARYTAFPRRESLGLTTHYSYFEGSRERAFKIAGLQRFTESTVECSPWVVIKAALAERSAPHAEL